MLTNPKPASDLELDDDEVNDLPITPEEKRVLDERLKTIDEDAAKSRPAEEVLERLRRRRSRR